MFGMVLFLEKKEVIYVFREKNLEGYRLYVYNGIFFVISIWVVFIFIFMFIL